MFRSFIDTLTSPSAPWRPSPEDQVTFCTAVEALNATAPGFEAVPHISWYGKYGCALLCSSPYAGIVTLELLCLDQWQLRMHPNCEECKQTGIARGDGAALDPVGHIAAEKFDSFMYVNLRSTELCRTSVELLPVLSNQRACAYHVLSFAVPVQLSTPVAT
eukprot:6179700-Pleurochrysis_carterae.AAC.4